METKDYVPAPYCQCGLHRTDWKGPAGRSFHDTGMPVEAPADGVIDPKYYFVGHEGELYYVAEYPHDCPPGPCPHKPQIDRQNRRQ